MKRGTWMKLVVGALLSGCAVFTACGDDGDTTTAPVDGGNDSAADTGTPPDQDGGDGPTSDQASPGDDAEAGGRDGAAKPDSEANCISLDKCDCDNDGYRSSTVACRPDAGDAGDAGFDAANSDCDDLDPVVYPGTNRPYFTDKNPPRMGDVNCNGTVEKQYNVNLACGVALPCAGEGFLNDPPCGTAAPYYTCGGLALCGAQANGMRTQGCR